MTWTHGQFHWNELNTRNVEQAKNFYAATLGWNFDAMPMDGSTYWLAMVDGEPVAGLFDISAPEFSDVPESWLPYIAVDDVDARIRLATKAGAKVMKPASDLECQGVFIDNSWSRSAALVMMCRVDAAVERPYTRLAPASSPGKRAAWTRRLNRPLLCNGESDAVPRSTRRHDRRRQQPRRDI